jgi:hypothetical protein
MKIKQILFLLSFFVTAISENNFSQSNLSEEKQVIKTLRTFYKEYFTEQTKIGVDGIVGTGTNYAKVELIRKKYCTQNFLVKLRKTTENELDYDPLVNAQDFDMKSYETLKIIRDKKGSNVYLISFDYFKYDKDNIQEPIKIVIVKDKGIYKIDSISDPYWKL